jgi:endonuclease/exonuclease/phosphatase family metal-dependent hydrolase
MKKLFITSLFLLFWVDVLFASVKVCSWNLQNFGRSKTSQTLDFIANSLQAFDVIAIEEVVAGDGGAPAVARLADFMNRKGKSWDYCISDPTSTKGHKSERYAFIWNKSKVAKSGDAWLENKFSGEIEREPYMATFRKEGKSFTLACFHAVPKSAKPETEIKFLKLIPAVYPSLNLIFCGDFNCPQSHSVFNPLKKMGYLPAMQNQKTTLRDKCMNGDCLASEFDNFFFDHSRNKMIEARIVQFYQSFADIREAKKISDHVPVSMIFEIK